MVRADRRPAHRLKIFKPVLFALIAANTVYFAASGSASKFVDSAAWLVLLALFEAETSFAMHLAGRRGRRTVRALRLVAGAGVFAAIVGYVFEENVLDAVNSVLWIAVVVLLETELRFPGLVQRARLEFTALAVALYGALAVLVVLWTLRGDWIDAYDAALWLTAFVMLEMAVSKPARTLR